MPYVISIANQKGGVGKTTTTMNLGSALVEQGYKVLLIDSDPQANLTSYLGVTPGIAPYEEALTLDQVYLSRRPLDATALSKLITPTESGLDVIASDTHLTGVDHFLFSRPDRELVLERFLAGIKNQYDWILIDTPPSLNLLTLNALCASDSVLIPVQAEYFSLEGIVKIRTAIEDIRFRWNPKLKILGVFANQVSGRRKLTEEVLETLRGGVGSLLLDCRIPDNASITESTGHAKSIFAYDRTCKGALQFSKLAKEVTSRAKQ